MHAPFPIPAHITPAEPTILNLLYNKTTIFYFDHGFGIIISRYTKC